MTYAPACGRSHILPLQQLFPLCFDVMGHFPPAQQAILPSLSFDIMAHCLPSLPWQQEPSFPHAPSLPQHVIVESALS
jgi:hypothetical protein